jgi:hypothetical protein
MIPQADFIDALEVRKVRSWVLSQDEDIQIAAAQEVARMRILDATSPLFLLRYTHSESTFNSAMSNLSAPSVATSFQVFKLDLEQIISSAEFEVRRLGTTRSDDFWRRCGVGRPSKKCEALK